MFYSLPPPDRHASCFSLPPPTNFSSSGAIRYTKDDIGHEAHSLSDRLLSVRLPSLERHSSDEITLNSSRFPTRHVNVEEAGLYKFVCGGLDFRESSYYLFLCRAVDEYVCGVMTPYRLDLRVAVRRSLEGGMAGPFP